MKVPGPRKARPAAPKRQAPSVRDATSNIETSQEAQASLPSAEIITKTCKIILECGTEGMGPAEIAVELGTDVKTLQGWAATSPEIGISLTQARARELAHWERIGREGANDRSFNATGWKHNMEFRFGGYGYGPKPARVEMTGKDGGAIEYRNLSEAELEQRFQDALARELGQTVAGRKAAAPTVN